MGKKMIDTAEVGRRIKKIRESRFMTLKDVERKARISATHVSEIERGMTSPTINILIRIAEALEKDPAYFVEQQELEDVSFVSYEDRETDQMEKKDGSFVKLTRSIPGGRITARLITLEPDGSGKFDQHTHEADEAALVLEGEITFRLRKRNYTLKKGESIYIVGTYEHDYVNALANGKSRMLWFGADRNIR
ncbi:MAG: helix-turn-helix domain-containing protein [Candidatus Latescibacteria bacterium]|nr:helix-turn-helix domain-containing protein [bacterium]MBD3423134.1 helix-turn-helix domain-containing protein [Candidatus Latescibacterota bacterium]